MSFIVCIGETVFDIIFKNNVPVDGKAGGSMLNASVSLGRLGTNVNYISVVGNDTLGKEIVTFLNSNNVHTGYSILSTAYKTNIALAFLNERGNATYSFYKSDYFSEFKQTDLPEFRYLLFGSFFSMHQLTSELLLSYIKRLDNMNGVALYDPNVRKSGHEYTHIHKQLFFTYVSLCSVLRASDEDLFHLLNETDFSRIVTQLTEVNKNLIIIYTMAERGVYYYVNNKVYFINDEPIDVISSIGAGDTFNAGLLYWMYKNQFTKTMLLSITEMQLLEMVKTAMYFARKVCTIYDNYLDLETAEKFKI